MIFCAIIHWHKQILTASIAGYRKGELGGMVKESGSPLAQLQVGLSAGAGEVNI